MQLIATTLASTLGLSICTASITEQDSKREFKVERHVQLDPNATGGPLQALVERLGGTIEVDVEIQADADGEDIDVDVRNLGDLLRQIDGVHGEITAVIEGPDGHRREIRRDLGDLELRDILNELGLGELLASPENGHRHRSRPGDMHDMDPEIREHIMEMMRQGYHMPEGMNPLDAHRRNDDRGERFSDRGMHDMDREDHGNWDDDGHHEDDGAERFMRAAESFMEQLQYAKAVGEQLSDDTGVALLGIWYASESMEPDRCLDLMTSIMNDDAIARNVRRAAGFVAIEKARDMDNHDGAQRILDAIIRGAGTTAPGPHLHQQTDRVTDRAPQRDRPRDTDAKRKSQRDKKKGGG